MNEDQRNICELTALVPAALEYVPSNEVVLIKFTHSGKTELSSIPIAPGNSTHATAALKELNPSQYLHILPIVFVSTAAFPRARAIIDGILPEVARSSQEVYFWVDETLYGPDFTEGLPCPFEPGACEGLCTGAELREAPYQIDLRREVFSWPNAPIIEDLETLKAALTQPHEAPATAATLIRSVDHHCVALAQCLTPESAALYREPLTNLARRATVAGLLFAASVAEWLAGNPIGAHALQARMLPVSTHSRPELLHSTLGMVLRSRPELWAEFGKNYQSTPANAG